MKKPNLAIFTSAHGGLAHYVIHLYKPLEKYANLYYVTYADSAIDDLVNSEVHKVYPLLEDIGAGNILNILKFLKDKKIDFINFNIGTTARKMYLYYVILLSRAKLMGIKVISTIHDVLPFESFYTDPAAMELLYSCSDHYIVGNEAEVNKLKLYFRVPDEKITVIKHGPYTIFDNNKYSKITARKKLDIPQDKKVILFFGLLRPHKGLKFLIKAFKGVLNKIPDSWLYISTDLSYSPQLNEFLQRIEKTGVSKSIQLVKGYVPSDEIEAIFKAADVVVLPYTQVSQSGILNLAYAFKKPVVVTDIFPEADIIDNKFGAVAKTADISSLEKAIVEILQKNPSELSKMGVDAYKQSIKSSSWDKAASTINNIITKLKKES